MQHLDEGRLQAWLDHPRSGLGPGELEAIERHLEECRACGGMLEELRAETAAVEALFRAGAADDAVPPFADVQARARKAGTVTFGRRGWRAPAWAASVVLALGVGWMANEMIERGRVPASVPAPPVAEPETEALSDIEPPAAVARAEESRVETVGVAGSAQRERVPAPAIPESPMSEASAPEQARLVAEGTEPGPTVVRGRVVGESGRPLQSAQVFVPEIGVGTLTGADGTFVLALDTAPPAVASENLTLSVELIGYRPERRIVPFRPGDSVSADFRLSSTAIALQELVVTGQADAIRPAVDWRAVDLDAGQAEAGFRPLVVPGLGVVRVELARILEAPVVRIVHTTEDGMRVVLIQGRDARAVEVAAGDSPRGAARVTTTRDGLTIVATGEVEQERLEALAAGIRRR